MPPRLALYPLHAGQPMMRALYTTIDSQSSENYRYLGRSLQVLHYERFVHKGTFYCHGSAKCLTPDPTNSGSPKPPPFTGPMSRKTQGTYTNTDTVLHLRRSRRGTSARTPCPCLMFEFFTIALNGYDSAVLATPLDALVAVLV